MTSLLKKSLAVIVLGLILTLGWLATTENSAIWPVRNTLQYKAVTWWWERTGYPKPGAPGTLQGTVRDEQSRLIAGAWILAARWDGTTYTGRSDVQGRYTVAGIPAGRYQPVVGAPGYQDTSLGRLGGVVIEAEAAVTADVVLVAKRPAAVVPGRNLALGDPVTLSCRRPFESSAVRRQVTFDNAGQPNQPTFLYVPTTLTQTNRLPTLLTVYPGPAAGWECASIPLATAGYAVVSIGPAYSFEPEKALDELQRLVAFVRAGAFPGSDGSRLAVLGGSYSGLHVQRLLQRDQSFQAAVLLGAPTDLFDMRRRLESGTFIPPFGLDQALVALGFPHREPLRYWRYSGAYHIRQELPPLAVLHSRTDEVVPYQQSRLLADNLALAGARFELHFFEGASHYLLSDEKTDEDSLLVYDLTLDFLAQHLR